MVRAVEQNLRLQVGGAVRSLVTVLFGLCFFGFSGFSAAQPEVEIETLATPVLADIQSMDFNDLSGDERFARVFSGVGMCLASNEYHTEALQKKKNAKSKVIAALKAISKIYRNTRDGMVLIYPESETQKPIVDTGFAEMSEHLTEKAKNDNEPLSSTMNAYLLTINSSCMRVFKQKFNDLRAIAETRR